MKFINKPKKLIKKFTETTILPNKSMNLIALSLVFALVLIGFSGVTSENPAEFETENNVQNTEEIEVKSKITHISEVHATQKTDEDTNINKVEYLKVKMFTTTSVNMRKNPNTNSEIITQLNDSVVVTSKIEKGNKNTPKWCFVTYKGKSGYINSNYLKEYNKDIHLDIGLEYVYQDYVRELIEVFELDVDEYFFYGMMYTENRFEEEPESSAGAQGLLQIMPSTWSSLYQDFHKKYPKYAKDIVNDPMDKKSNITLAMYCVKRIKDSYGYDSLSEHASQVLTSYNHGIYGAKKYYNAYGTYSSEYSKEILRASKYIREHKTWKEGI